MLRRGGLAALALLLPAFFVPVEAAAAEPASAPAPASAPDASSRPDPSSPPPPPIEIPAPVAAPQGPLHMTKPPRVAADTGDYVTERFEPAGFPLIGGDSDIGFEFGAVGTLSYFCCGVKPYRWNMDMLLSASVKQGPHGAELAQQNYLWQLDMPGLFGGAMRLNPEVSYNHTVNYGYFGLGDASTPTVPASNTNPGRYHEWVQSIGQVRSSARIRVKDPVAVELAAQYLYVSPTAYDQSLLAQDAATQTPSGPTLYGTTAVSLPSLAAGFVWDSRDNEMFPTPGCTTSSACASSRGSRRTPRSATSRPAPSCAATCRSRGRSCWRRGSSPTCRPATCRSTISSRRAPST